MNNSLNIAWVARDGYIDLFPKIAAQLVTAGVSVNNQYICHTRNDAMYLKETYNLKDIDTLAAEVNSLLSNVQKPATKQLNKLAQQYNDIPMVRALWTSRFEMKIDEEELQRQAVAHILFWQDYLTKHNIDILVYERPSILSTCMAWLVCQRLEIKCIDFVDTAVDTMTITDNWRGDYAEELTATIANCQLKPQHANHQQAEAYLNKMLNRPKKTNEALLASKITNYRGTLSFARIKKLYRYFRAHKYQAEYYLYDKPFYHFIWRQLRYIGIFNLHKIADFFAKDLQPENDRFFLFPLFMQGEYSNHIFMKLDYWDQVAIVKQLAQCLPPGYKLYVKEHHSMFAEHELKLYKQLRAIPGVKLVSPHADTFQLIQQSQGICTLGSTMGFEAILMNKPVMLLGEPWYRNLAGIYAVDNCYQITEFMANARKLKPLSYEEKLKIIYALFTISFPAIKCPREGFLADNNIISMTQAMKKYIDQHSTRTALNRDKTCEAI